MEVLKKGVRSPGTATNEALTPAQLEQEYLAMTGKSLPPCELAFQSTSELVAAAPAVEMPSLEPSCETESFHLRAEEKSEPVETQAADLGECLKQPQDLEQSLLDKLILTPEIPPDAVQDSNLCCLPPLERECMVGVFVGFIVSPSQFYIHICSRETPDELQDMMFEMRHLYSHKLVSDRYIMPESAVRPGQLCCATVAKWWYRVIIHRVINDQEVEVFYADYGNLEIVRKSWLRFLKWCYLKLPAQAIPCSLARVKPAEDTWSRAATLLFKELCGSSLLVGIVDEYVNGILHLFLCNTSTKEDVYFHRVLTDGGYADNCGENIPSQGFLELNPLALYVQPSGQQERAQLVEPTLRLQQESRSATSETASSKLEGDEVCDQNHRMLRVGRDLERSSSPTPLPEQDHHFPVQWHPSAEEETRGDAQPLLDEVSVLRTTDQAPELVQEDTKETPAELMAVAQTPLSLEESSMPAVLFKSVEDFDTSFIDSKQPAEMSQAEPHQKEPFSSKSQHREAVHPSVLLMAMPFVPDNDEERMKNKDLPRHLAAEQGPAQNLYVPPTALSTVVSSARLAAPGGHFHWFPSLTNKCEERGEAGAAPEEGCLEP